MYRFRISLRKLHLIDIASLGKTLGLHFFRGTTTCLVFTLWEKIEIWSWSKDPRVLYNNEVFIAKIWISEYNQNGYYRSQEITYVPQLFPMCQNCSSKRDDCFFCGVQFSKQPSTRLTAMLFFSHDWKNMIEKYFWRRKSAKNPLHIRASQW